MSGIEHVKKAWPEEGAAGKGVRSAMGSPDVRPAQEVTHEDRHQVRGRRARRRRPADELGEGERDDDPERDDERVLED
jgi:hypothetical protein